ncbi:MAG: hypothetical protein HOI91_13635 [Halieaceae bacterium]|nr:hypothetical protein [Halieaceae bacterium]
MQVVTLGRLLLKFHYACLAAHNAQTQRQIDLRLVANTSLPPTTPINSAISNKAGNEMCGTGTAAVDEPSDVSHASPMPSASTSNCCGLAAGFYSDEEFETQVRLASRLTEPDSD